MAAAVLDHCPLSNLETQTAGSQENAHGIVPRTLLAGMRQSFVAWAPGSGK